MAQRLGHLEDFVSEDGLGDLPLDAESIEMMLGIDASSINVVADGGSDLEHFELRSFQEVRSILMQASAPRACAEPGALLVAAAWCCLCACCTVQTVASASAIQWSCIGFYGEPRQLD